MLILYMYIYMFIFSTVFLNVTKRFFLSKLNFSSVYYTCICNSLLQMRRGDGEDLGLFFPVFFPMRCML